MKNNTIIVIDDSPSVLLFMDHCLSEYGYKILTFKNPLDAIREIPKLETPIMIICDYIMFDKDGFQVIEDLREAGVFCRYILFTSFQSEEVHKLCNELGIIYIDKELNKQKIMEVIRCL